VDVAGGWRRLHNEPEGKTPLVRARQRWEDIRMDLREIRWNVWTGCIWLRIGTSDGLLWTRLWTFGFHKRWGISWLAEWMLASEEGLCLLHEVS
jgi:hypothetical protein